MKKMMLNKTMRTATLLVACASIGLFSCHKTKDNNNNTTNPPPSSVGTTVVKDSIYTNTHWTKNMHILIKGYVYVTKGHTLTIDAGTIIKGDKASKGALIIERGAKIHAIGTSSMPIIFTSNEPAGQRTYGDWGGVILCGYAPNNWVAASKTDGTIGTLSAGIGQVEGGPRSLYGGTDLADNSGTMQYCRVEFGGVAFSPNNEINGLTLCSVGSGTVIDHIQVSYSGDDSYEWFGGTVNCNNLVAFKGWDDDFDTDNGFSGAIQYGMIYRDPNAADQSGSHSFESDSDNESSHPGNAPLTKTVFQNVTTVGPLRNPGDLSYNPNFVCGQVVRRASSLSVYNSLLIGWPLGVIVDEDPSYGSTVGNITGGTLVFKNNAVVGTAVQAGIIVSRLNDVHSSPNSLVTSGFIPSTVKLANDSVSVNWGAQTGPITWFNAGKNYYGATEGLTSRLLYAFNNTGAPSFVPASTSYTVFNNTNLPAYMNGTLLSAQTGGKYPSYPGQPLNTDTTNKFANYNAPSWLPNMTVAGHQDYIGAFNLTDNWIANWTNFDPVNANYGAKY